MKNLNFWKNLDDPIVGMAPMDGVTDAAFRYIVCKCRRAPYDRKKATTRARRTALPSFVMTEFVNVEGLARGATRMLVGFQYNEIEWPIVAQIFGIEVESFYKAAVMLCAMGFDGIDINMGCPMKKVALKGSGAGLIQTPDLACRIIEACKRGRDDWGNGIGLEEAGVHEGIIEWMKTEDSRTTFRAGGNDSVDDNFVNRTKVPVSVKTRIGYDSDISGEWIGRLLEAGPDAIILHGRTLRQMYCGEADWEAIGRAGEIVRETGVTFIGNGDVKSLNDAREKIAEYGVDGVIVGRAVLGNPWFFDEKYSNGDFDKISKKERFKVLMEHCEYFQKNLPEMAFYNIKKHLAWYCKGFDGAREMRMALMGTNNFGEVKKIVEI